MKKYYPLLFIIMGLLAYAPNMRAQNTNDEQKIIQVTGVLKTPDSLNVIPYAVVNVMGRESGVMTNDRGVFSLVVNKGDRLLFELTGYKSVVFQVPYQYNGIYLNIVQLMSQDTFYLPETIITSGMTPEEFDFAFKYKYVPRDEVAYMRRNNNPITRKMLMYSLPKNGVEGATRTQMQHLDAYGRDYGQMPVSRSSNLLNWKQTWQETLDSWRRSDYRK